MPGWAFALAFVVVFAAATLEGRPSMNAFFGSAAQKTAAIRAAWSATGTGLLTLFITWGATNDQLWSKPVVVPAVVAALTVLGFRGFAEGRIDRGTTTIKV